MVLEAEKRALTLDMATREDLPESERNTLEMLLAQRYQLNQVIIRAKSEAFPRPADPASKGKKISTSGKIILGREIKGHVLPMRELNPKAGRVVVEGKVFKFDCHETRRPGMWVLVIEMTDYTGSVIVRRNMLEAEIKPVRERVSEGMWLRVGGTMELTYDGKDMQLNPRDITEIAHEGRMDNAKEKRVELHLHTKMSNMDALTDTKSVVNLAAKWGMPAIAITDHGVAQSFPDAWHAGEGKIKILYGCEGYYLNNIDDRIAVHGTQDGDFSSEIVCFDIETTGLNVKQEAITEIGAVVLKDGEVTDTFQTFVDPERRLTPEIIGLTGITDEMLRGAPKLKDALTAFLQFAGGRVLAAHNAEFDISFIRAGCEKCGLAFDPTYLDSLIFAQNLLPGLGKYKLDVVANHLQLPQFNHHRASDDAVPVAQMLAKFFPMLEQRGVTRLQQINDEMVKLRPLGGRTNRF
ncbi:MAG: PHP domain-containing protein, partial [Oscillospiraceae bacterium]|nr:PHP domain-containing protein [Oscillospiraceae bacterium]